MKTTQYGELVLDQQDLCDQIMQGQEITNWAGVTVDTSVDVERLAQLIQDPGQLLTWTFPHDSTVSVPVYDAANQAKWHMPDQYQQMDIAQHVLSLCKTDAELQRAGQELLMFQERNLFDLLKFLVYLVDLMQQNNMIWGVGRGSSVASYVLYLLGVHRVNSMYYELDPGEFLR
jgi:DNA polymerase III alpha subunit